MSNETCADPFSFPREVRSVQDAARGALAALDAYRNTDGGYGWALEPDLRSPESQPGAARG